ncbi:MAG: hypothetical protein M3N53_11380 [Actinomycetota bacterium]|nr:hypothetical protein [Actinomycetota bacterium]
MRHPTHRGVMRRSVGFITATVMVLGLFGPATAGPTLGKRARVAAGYVASQQNEDGSFPGFSPLGSTSDAILSLVAVRRGPRAIEEGLDFLEANVAEADTIGEKAKLVMAAVAGGRDPRNFGGENLVQQILDSEQQNGRYGATTEVFNHALAILALVAAPGADPSSNALTWLIEAQCGDGGWQFDEPQRQNENEHCQNPQDPNDFFQSDTNTTSYAVQAIAAHPQATAPLEKSPFRFFRQIRDPEKNGWGFDRAFNLTDANSTALVIQAFAAFGKRLPAGAMKALTRLQYRLCGQKRGAFARSYEQREDGTYKKTPPDPGATIGAILGLLKEPLPVEPATVTRPVPRATAC